jgi:PKD repeat protein
MKKQLLVLFTLLALIGFSQSGQACQASFTWVADSSGGVQFTNTSTGVFGGNAQWSFGDGTSSTQQNPYHQYNASSFWMVCLTMWDSAGCQSTYCDTIVTGGSTGGCQASFTPTVNGNTVQFSNTSSGTYSGLLWSYGDGTSGTSPSHTYANSGIYNVCLNIGTNPASSCSDVYCATLVIQANSNCNAQFSAWDSSGTGSVYFSPAVYSANWNYYWSFGDGTTSSTPDPIHNYNANGAFNVCLTVVDSSQNCSDTWCDSVLVGTPPPGPCVANFSYQQTNGIVYFYGYNASPGASFSSWNWTFGDGSAGLGQNPVHTYTANGIYTVCLIGSNFLCSDTICTTVVVNTAGSAGCDASFSVYDSAGVHYFFPNVISSNINYFWDFGDNTSSTSAIGVHQYNGTGFYLACLTVTDSSLGCTATSCDTVVIGGNPIPCQAYFSYSTDSLGNVQFYNASTGNYSNVLWSLGDGTSSTQLNPNHAYSGTGPYIACLTIFGNNPSNACQSSFCDTIYPGLNANSCVPVFYTFPDSSSFGNGNMNFALMNTCANTTYVWSFGDGTTITTTSSAPAPIHQYPATGWYNVCVTATTPTNTYNYCNQIYAFRGATGLNSIDRLEASVFPNPASLNAIVRFEAAGQTTLDVLSLEGRLVYTQNAGSLSGEVQLPLDISTLENGVYFVRLRSGELNGTVRILVQH